MKEGYKEKPNCKERGITLVALIITIIVLIILGAVTINIAFKNNFIGIATKGTENYAQAQVEEDREFEELYEDLEKHVESIRQSAKSQDGKITATILSRTQTSITISVEYSGEEETNIECTLKEEGTDEIKTGNRIGETLNFEFKDLKAGADYILNITYEDGTQNLQMKIHTPKIIVANSSEHQTGTMYGNNYGDFLQCINNSELSWAPPVHSNTRVDTMYLELELDEKMVLRNFSMDGSTYSGNYQWGSDYGYYGFVLMVSNDGINFETLSEKKTLVTATTQVGLWYENNFTFDIQTPYKIYKIAFIDGGKDGITAINSVGSCVLKNFRFSFE